MFLANQRFIFLIFTSVAPHRGQPAAKCHPRWQPTRRLAVSCGLGRHRIRTRDCRTTVWHATIELPRLPVELPRLPIELPRLPIELPRLPIELPCLPIELPRLPIELPHLPDTTFSLFERRRGAKRELAAFILAQEASYKNWDGGTRNSMAENFAEALQR
jgi:hypothetical protein